MTTEELVDALIVGGIDKRDEAIKRISEGDRAIACIAKARIAFSYADNGDYSALNIAKSIIEEYGS